MPLEILTNKEPESTIKVGDQITRKGWNNERYDVIYIDWDSNLFTIRNKQGYKYIYSMCLRDG